MGYQHRARKVACPKCKKQVAWFWDSSKKVPDAWACDCGVTNHIKPLPEWPPVPRTLYIGPDKLARLKVFPLPPESPNERWAQPYSIRSFVSQASEAYGGCHYTCKQRGEVMDEIVFTDGCYDDDTVNDDYSEPHQCHLVAGWTTGEDSCPLWQRIQNLCQTDTERRFLHQYLRYVKDRQFPMLVPQANIGIAERRRPDFVAFVPLQYWNYQWLAIQLDGAHPPERAEDDSLRDQYIQDQKYEVLSLRPNEKGYLEEVRRLVEKIEASMVLADTDPWKVAVDAEVRKSVERGGDDIPF